MANVRERTAENPTTSRSKVVASPRSEQGRAFQKLLDGVLRFITRKRVWPDVEGDLSSWILFGHGFDERTSSSALKSRYDEKTAAAASFLNQFLGPEMNVREVEKLINQSEKVADEKIAKMVEAHRRGDPDAFQSLFSEGAIEVADALGVPHEFTERLGLSFDQAIKMIRATRASVLCLTIHNESPLVLISRASKGDRRAVLDLVKADKLFMHDSCCSKVIRKAELQEDVRFTEQLRRALGYQAVLRSRDLHHVYYYIVFLLEHWGISLPTLNELRNTLDRHGEYKSLSAFERDFQRRRLDFARILAEAEAELPTQ